MNRRSLGRGRLIVAIGATLALLGSVPAWWTIGGTVTPVRTGNGLEASGIVVFVSAILLLALIVLPYATRDGHSALDRPASYVLVALSAVAGFVVRLVEINAFGGLALPDKAPGAWLTGAGLLLVAWGVAEILAERPAPY